MTTRYMCITDLGYLVDDVDIPTTSRDEARGSKREVYMTNVHVSDPRSCNATRTGCQSLRESLSRGRPCTRSKYPAVTEGSRELWRN